MTTTGLNSALMDTEPTQAVPTREDETQNIYAWSIDDAPDMVEVHHHSWKLPIAIAILALAAAIAGIIQLSPNNAPPAATKPSIAAPATPSIQPTQTPAPKPENKDDLYARLLTEKGIPLEGPAEVTGSNGRGICARISHGESHDQMVRDVMTGSGISAHDASIWVDTAIAVYCPTS